MTYYSPTFDDVNGSFDAGIPLIPDSVRSENVNNE